MLPCRTDLRANSVPPRCVTYLLLPLSPTGVQLPLYLYVISNCSSCRLVLLTTSSQTKEIESLFKLPFKYFSVLR